MLGLSVRLVATVAAVYSLHLWLGLYRHPAEWPWNYMFLAIVHVQFAVSHAGRSLGIDALIRRRAPITPLRVWRHWRVKVLRSAEYAFDE